MRLPQFEYLVPRTLSDALLMKADAGPAGSFVAGGTDLYPNMKRRQQTPATVISVSRLAELRSVSGTGETGMRIGAGVSLTDIVDHPVINRDYPVVAQAAASISTPILRNMGTIGGNLLLDTRCNYYDQNYEWRKAIGFCLKKDGDTCWVATGSSKCMAVSSTDTAPALMALGARVRLVSRSGEREVPLTDLYQNDGIHYMKRQPNELLTEVLVESLHGWKSAYWKLRRRGAFDFPVLSVAAAAKISAGGIVEDARIVVGSVACLPLVAVEASAFLKGRALSQDSIAQAAAHAALIAKPLDNTDFDMTWRKRVTAEFVTYALRELRGDDMRAERPLLTRHSSSL